MGAAPTRTISRTTTLAAPPDVVFAVVMSPETAPLIDPAVRRWEADHRPIGAGTRFTIRGRLGWVPIAARSEVVRWEPPAGATFRTLRPTWPLSMTADHSFAPTDDGRTTYTWSITYHEENPVGRPAIAIAARLFEPALDAQAEALDTYLRALPPDTDLPAL